MYEQMRGGVLKLKSISSGVAHLDTLDNMLSFVPLFVCYSPDDELCTCLGNIYSGATYLFHEQGAQWR